MPWLPKPEGQARVNNIERIKSIIQSEFIHSFTDDEKEALEYGLSTMNMTNNKYRNLIIDLKRYASSGLDIISWLNNLIYTKGAVDFLKINNFKSYISLANRSLNGYKDVDLIIKDRQQRIKHETRDTDNTPLLNANNHNQFHLGN